MRQVRLSDSVTLRAYASGGCPAAVDAMDPRDMSEATAATAAAARGACLPSRCPKRPSRPSTCTTDAKTCMVPAVAFTVMIVQPEFM